jgi:hypothetical protein
MRNRIMMLAAVLALLAGCATSGNGVYPSAFPGDESLSAERASCTQSGGMWHDKLGICEQSDD